MAALIAQLLASGLLMAPQVSAGPDAPTLLSIAQADTAVGPAVIVEARLPPGSVTDTSWDEVTDALTSGRKVRPGRAARALVPGDLAGVHLRFRITGFECRLRFEAGEPRLDKGCDPRVEITTEPSTGGERQPLSRRITVNLPGRKR
jgi:hypothetical protein